MIAYIDKTIPPGANGKNLSALSGNKVFMMRLLSLPEGRVFPFAGLYQAVINT